MVPPTAPICNLFFLSFFSSLFTILQNTTMQKCSDISKVATFLLLCFWLSHSECLWGNYIQHLHYFTRSLICLFVSFLSFNRCHSYRKTSDTENTALFSIYSVASLVQHCYCFHHSSTTLSRGGAALCRLQLH